MRNCWAEVSYSGRVTLPLLFFFLSRPFPPFFLSSVFPASPFGEYSVRSRSAYFFNLVANSSEVIAGGVAYTAGRVFEQRFLGIYVAEIECMIKMSVRGRAKVHDTSGTMQRRRFSCCLSRGFANRRAGIFMPHVCNPMHLW